MSDIFWFENPTILFKKDKILNIWTTNNMSPADKVNSIARFIIILTILGYILFPKQKTILIFGIISLFVLAVLAKTLYQKRKITKELLESFKSGMITDNEGEISLATVLKSEFKEGNKKNPFSNVLLTDINDNPERKSAQPSFNPDVETNITKNIKKLVQSQNPEIINTNKQIFGDLYENWELDQSNRQFYSTPNSRVEPGDQGSLGKWLYDGLKYSAKESTPEGAIARVKDSYRYTLY
jgi:hypothetical protein